MSLVVQDAIAPESSAGRLGGDGKLENLTLWERVYLHLREEILANRLPPGTDLLEVQLSESLGVSRGPIREALGRLATEGLVVVRPRRGAVVTPLSKDEFRDAYQVREALETLAVRLAVPRLGADEHEELAALVEAMGGCESSGDVTGFFRANDRFHAIFVAASGNQRLQDLYRQLVAQLARYQSQSLALRGSLRRSISEHRTILRAAVRGDADRAAHLMSEHIRVPQRRLESTAEDALLAAVPDASLERIGERT